MGSPSKRFLPLVTQMALLVILVCPQLVSSVVTQLTSSSQSSGLTAAYGDSVSGSALYPRREYWQTYHETATIARCEQELLTPWLRLSCAHGLMCAKRSFDRQIAACNTSIVAPPFLYFGRKYLLDLFRNLESIANSAVAACISDVKPTPR